MAFPDLLLSRGEYQFKPEPPFTLGVDFAGVVLDPGSPESSRQGSNTFTVGQRVAGVNLSGGAAEQVANPAIFTFALPDAMSYDEGAALPMNYLTALFALEERGGLRDRETVLVHGAAGGVGTATLQVAKGLGARTIAVVSTEEKAAFARAAGADEVVVGPDFKDAVKELTGGRGVDVVLDVVGGDAFTDSLRCLAEQGRVLVVGFAAGQGIPEVKVNRLLLGNTDVRGVGWGAYAMTRPGLHAEAVAPPRPDDRVGRREAAGRRDVRPGRLRAGARRHGRAAHPRQVGRARALMLRGWAPGVRVERVTILDAARDGMNPDIRPQDDLFGHVNGRWLDETEIPSDKSSWGAFIALADAAEQQVRDIITELADRPADELDEDERKIGDLYASFMDTETIAAKGLEPVRGLLDQAHGVATSPSSPPSSACSSASAAPACSAPTSPPTAATPRSNIVYLAQGGLGLPDESYYRDDKFAEIREKYLAYLTTLLTLSEHDDPAGAAARVLAYETRLAEGHWEAAATRDVQKTTNHKSLEELRRALPGLRLGHLRHRPRRHRGDAAHARS